jgi:hypothetical protein
MIVSFIVPNVTLELATKLRDRLRQNGIQDYVILAANCVVPRDGPVSAVVTVRHGKNRDFTTYIQLDEPFEGDRIVTVDITK